MNERMRDIDPDHLAAALETGATLVDVREVAEYANGHVPGAALVPMGQLPARVDELDREAPVYVICASGNRSASMTAFLVNAGFDAYNVVGGTTAWSCTGRSVEQGVPSAIEGGFTIVPLETATLGDRSYLVHDGRVAFVVDPQRDIDRLLDLAERAGVRITHVFETHIHNDYVTGGLALAQHTGAAYHINAADPVSFDRTSLRDLQTVAVGGRMRVTALATPGHTFTHLSFVLTDAEAEAGSVTDGAGQSALDAAVAVFSGGSLLYGATGRPDLLGHPHTHDLVRLQHASAHRLADTLPDDAAVFPTHGFGSFCSATQSEATESTIGQERFRNPVLTQNEETYVRDLLAGLDAYPAYYAHMGPANSAGPSAPDLSAPTPADPGELRQRIDAGEWVVDLRHRTAFAAGHLPGTLNFGIDGDFATYLGWLIEWGTPLTLLGSTADEVANAQRELVRIGIDRPAAAATGGPADWATGELGKFPTATFADLGQVRHHRTVTVLDVRRVHEYDDARIEGAVNIPLHELTRRLDDVPAGEVWVHCGAGYRASVAASMLAARGRAPVAIDDSFDNATQVGLPMVGKQAA